jgi:uncharacterized membrane protein (DUF2068 family)
MLSLLADIICMKFEGLSAIALLEGAKGMLALSIIVLINLLAGQELHRLTERVVVWVPMSASHQYLTSFLHFLERMAFKNTALVTTVLLLYASFRFVVAYGLWYRLRWTQWLAFISGSIYIPFELYAIYLDPSRMNVAILLLNLLVVFYLYWVLRKGEGLSPNALSE